uniref:hypothetical protein n=1 Tax=uncultured Draconibacterium sp. TaxID=1573823 RepID=UPI003217E9D0
MEPLLSEKYFHIYNHSIGNELIFREDKNYVFFLEKYKQYILPVADTMVFCLMPNHFHLLVRIKKSECIESLILESVKGKKDYTKLNRNEDKEDYQARFVSKQFSNFFSSYTQAYNLIYGRRGSLFMKNFKRKEIGDDDYFIRLVNYIHRNPVNHGFVNKPQEWKYSSYNAIISDKVTLVKRAEVLEWFGGLGNFMYNHLRSMEL